MADDREPDDEEIEAEIEELEDFGGDDLPPPPPPPAPTQGGQAAPPQPPPPELIAISNRIKASTDNLEMQALVHAALCASVADVMQDPTISAAERRRELRTISAAAAKSFPYRRLYEAEQLIKADAAKIDARMRERRGATLEKREASAGGKVIPIRWNGKDRGIES